MEALLKMIPENGSFPNNNTLPLLIYKKALDIPHLNPELFETLFLLHGWTNGWRDGIYTFHHYHSNTHEVLGIYSGSCQVQIGGENGEVVQLEKGDVLIIPVGVSHKNTGSTEDFMCVGAYPFEIDYDTCYGKPEEKISAAQNIQKTPLPTTDPLYGAKGPLCEAWNIPSHE